MSAKRDTLSCPCCNRAAFKPATRWCYTHETTAADCKLLGYEGCKDVRGAFSDEQRTSCKCGCELGVDTSGEHAVAVVLESYRCSNRPRA
jgi:hypothetical protein